MKISHLIGSRIAHIQSILLDLLYPLHCPVCDELLLPGKRICSECLPKLSYVKAPRCLKCGKTIRDSAREYCRDCQRKPHQYIQGKALFEYPSVALSIYRFKYGGRREYAKFYARQIASCFQKIIEQWDADALVPVPIHPKRKRRRGYNQAEVLAKEISRYFDIPVESKLLRRVKNTIPQKLLDDRQRQNNLKNAFKLGQNDVKCKSAIIIDDIYTTGSTIDQCASVLRDGGVDRIYYIAIAIGREDKEYGGTIV